MSGYLTVRQSKFSTANTDERNYYGIKVVSLAHKYKTTSQALGAGTDRLLSRRTGDRYRCYNFSSKNKKATYLVTSLGNKALCF